MRIALVLPSVNSTEGVPNYVASLSRALSRDHQVNVVTGSYSADSVDGVAVTKVPYLNLGMTLSHATFMAGLYLAGPLSGDPHGEAYDIVHGAGYTCPRSNVVTAHYCEVRERRLMTGQSAWSSNGSWGQTLARWDQGAYRRLSAFMERRFYRFSWPTVVIAVSKSVKQELIDEFGTPEETIEVIPNGVDVQRFHPMNRLTYRRELRQELGLSESDTVALFVGNSWERKGLSLAIEAVEALSAFGVRLLVVGSGDPAAHGKSENVSGAGSSVLFVDRRVVDIQRYYAAADVLLLPSHYEPFGMVVMEALASGLPVIVSSVAGVAEYITEGHNGLLVHDLSNAGELTRRIASLIGSGELRENSATQGRLLAEQFSWDRIADLTVRAYDRALLN